MKIVSSYVREQKRYTKNELKNIFSFDEAGVEKFIKNLKAYGVLKSVKNNTAQLEMTDLLDEDIEITDETAESGDCLYVFTYVGVITSGSRVIKVYPKYLLSQKEPLTEMKQVIKVLERYSNSEEQIINIFNGDGDNRSFNILAVILFLLNDYYEYGIYTNSEDIIEINGEGEILWGKTIDESFAMIEDKRPYYMELYTGKTVEDDKDYFKRLHECVLTECSKQLHDAQLDELFGIDELVLSEEILLDFGDKDYILERLHKELNIQFNTRRQILLKTIYTYISQERRMLEENDGISMFGTTAYHAVWEKVCADVFDNKLNTTLGQLKMSVPLADEFKSRSSEALINIIEKPKWKGIDMEEVDAADTLIPDLISIPQINGTDHFIIFDAKYYNIQLEKGKSLRGNPGVGDVTKQYLYQLAYKDFIKAHNISVVKNCFLMPTEKNEIIKKGTARMPMLEALGLENIQIRLIPASMLYERYLAKGKIDIGLLEL
ncbi:LlaJI family restriction endonuclease [Clostridium cellulovorans]|uniref:Restriction endonuclease, type II, LlaJI n=1 Tax=Clostridium cellulovorans (strain ATCC 35296 / DSM 3052 / OCM 3 / 743B) TaxID=573061 RepID=D9SLN1_CLOC7|nr:LlaJI family restriction endonuclease [Clostridium cellulovorans]ADL53668.1 Restriction endonuclease, type II, LlaJI [Clostridium cellulovorans 743B]